MGNRFEVRLYFDAVRSESCMFSGMHFFFLLLFLSPLLSCETLLFARWQSNGTLGVKAYIWKRGYGKGKVSVKFNGKGQVR